MTKPILYAIAACLLTALAPCAAQAGDPFELEWSELAPGVHAGIRPDSPRTPVVGTTVLVIGDNGVLAYDAAGFALQGERLVEKVKSLTDLPVTHIVISHWHGDHHLGIHKVKEAWPDAEIVAHEFTAKALASPLMDYAKDGGAGMEAARATLEKIAAEGTGPDGAPLDPALVAYFTQTLDDFDLILAELKRLDFPAATLTVADRLEIDLGGRKVELFHVAPGNTKGDLAMYLPAEKILATGDIMVRPTPYGFGSYPESWAKVLRTLSGLDAEIIVPGHGDIQRDFAYAGLLAETLDLVAAQVAPLAAEGLSLDDVRERIDFSAVEERFTKGDPLLASRFNVWFKRPIVEAAWNVATGKGNEPLEAPAAE